MCFNKGLPLGVRFRPQEAMRNSSMALARNLKCVVAGKVSKQCMRSKSVAEILEAYESQLLLRRDEGSHQLSDQFTVSI